MNIICFPSKNKGSVLVEFVLVCLFVVVPLCIGVDLLAKHMENRQKLEMANRYAGWERTVWYEKMPHRLNQSDVNPVKSYAEITKEIQNRVFSDKTISIYREQRVSSVNESRDPLVKSYWVSKNNGSEEVFKIKNNKFIAGANKQKQPYGYSAGAMNSFLKLMSKVGDFKLNQNGVYTSTVNMEISKVDFIKDFIPNDFTVSKSYTIFTDGWNAGGADHAKKMVEDTVLLELLDVGVIDTLRNAVSIIPIAKEIHGSKLKFGYVVPDAVPSQRLKPYSKIKK